MPIFWRYMLQEFLSVLLLCLTAFVSILLITRLDDIAHFAGLGASWQHVLLFVVYQLPYILPIALPISALIAAIIIAKRMSQSSELTAFRAAGMNLFHIFSPVLWAALLLSLANFVTVSELATQSHLASGLLKNELRSINPLLLLHNKHLMRLKGAYFETQGASRLGEYADDVILALPNHKSERITLLLAKKLNSSQAAFSGQRVALLTTQPSEEEESYDPIFIENMGNFTTSGQDFSVMLQKKVWTLNNDHLRLPLLLAKIAEEKTALKIARAENRPISEKKQILRNISRGYSELWRRISAACSVLCFVLMGLAFGIQTGRKRSMRGIFLIIFLAAVYLVAYFAAKGIDHHLLASAMLYTGPLILIATLSCWNLKRLNCGRWCLSC